MFYRYQAAFTLIELIAVLVIVGVLSTTVLIRFSPSDLALQTERSHLISALVFARETAMARSDNNSIVMLLATENSIDVQVNGVSVNNFDQAYPLSFSDGVTLSSGDVNVLFTGLGETDAQTMTLSKGGQSVVVAVTGVGYAY